MINLGEINRLTIKRRTDNGFYLVDNEEHEVLLPNAYIREGWEINDIVDVFVFRDSEDRLTATTIAPKIKLYDFAMLRVKDVNKVGAFLDWGLPKDLFVPFREQQSRMQEGKTYPVTLFIDYESDRLLASNKIDKFLELEDIEKLEENQEVDLFVYKRTDLGFNVVIDKLYKGLLYHNEIFRPLQIGDELTGFIRTIREDKKIDVTLQKKFTEQGGKDQQIIIASLKVNDGFLGLNDKSSPEEIYEELKMSKKAFKRGIGGLYKNRTIAIKNDGIHLLKK